MDFSHNFYGSTQPSTYQFIGIPPLTPHSKSASDDYNNQSPPEVFDQFQSSEHFPNFDHYAQFSHQPQPLPGPPAPPTPPTTHPGMQAQAHPGAINGNAPIKNLHQADLLSMAKADADQGRNNVSNSDDDDMTPAQSRRKAQNRAAQRAFRERKERHVKDLEAKLAKLETAQQQTTTENEKLKRDLHKVSTENEILRAKSSVQGQNGSISPPAATTGPMNYNPTDFFSDLLANHANKTPSHRVVESDTGHRLLAAGATWDFIINHPLFKRGVIDVADVSTRLKPHARCDGQGPVFEECAIANAIKESVARGSDELI